MSAVDPNGGGALVIPASGGGLPPGGTATQLLRGDETWASRDSVVGAALGSMLTGEPAGTAIVADGAAGITTVVLPVSTPISLASTSGWTTSASAGCTATIDTGDEQVELALPASAGTFTNAYAVRTPPAVGSWEFRARLRGHSGGTNVGDVAQLIVYGPGGTLYAGVNVRGDDTIIMVCDVTPPAASAAASLRAGQGWVRVVCDGGTVRGYWGIGSAGDPPTSWTALGAAVRPSATAPYSFELRLSANRGATIVGDLAVTWGDLSYRSLDL